jgi:hypothetical protein
VNVFSQCGEVKKFPYTLSETCTHDLENSRIFAVLNRIFRNTGTEFFTTHKTTNAPGIPERTGSLFTDQPDVKILVLKLILLQELQSRELHVVMFHVKQVYCLRVFCEDTQLSELFRCRLFGHSLHIRHSNS